MRVLHIVVAVAALALFAPATASAAGTLTVTVTGGGTVTSDDGHINCGSGNTPRAAGSCCSTGH